jgi:hypothetical protein
MKTNLLASFIALLLTSSLWAQEQKPRSGAQDMSGMSMPGMKMPQSDSHDMPGADDVDTAHAMHSMEGRHMDMGPHMKMTTLRLLKPGDEARASQVVEAARRVAEHYTDYKTALNDGFEIFLPNVPQKMYHFTNYRYAFEASFTFNPDHPTSLLYEKHGNNYKLIGVMYTAPKYFSEDMLNERIPLSIAQWHAHVNLCIPPQDQRKEMLGRHPQFGLNGSISTKDACQAAGGTFRPQIFGWMVHVYPFEKTPEDIWSAERQMH